MIPTTAGVYEIVNRLTGDRYIGGTSNLRRRWSSHQTKLRRGVSSTNKHLKQVWAEHGEGVLGFNVLLICAATDVAFYEQLLVRELKPEYNIRTQDVASNLGVRLDVSPEAREAKSRLRSAMNRARRLSPETRQKISTAAKSRAKTYVFLGEEMTIRQAAEKYGLPEPTVRMRLANGWDPDKAALTPAKPDRRRINGRPITIEAG